MREEGGVVRGDGGVVRGGGGREERNEERRGDQDITTRQEHEIAGEDPLIRL
jgi:hypothetical protein